MAGLGRPTSPGVVGRTLLATATITAAALGFLADARWFTASGAFGIAWWAWDAIWDNVFGALGEWFVGMLTGTSSVQSPPDLTLDDTIRLLESHLRDDGVSRHVQIQSALRLAEIYRANKQAPERARDVIAKVRSRWPDAPELQAPPDSPPS